MEDGKKSLEDNNGLDDVDMEEVDRYVKKFDFPVHIACRNRVETKIIAYLIENTEKGKLTVNKMDNCSRFPLHYACRKVPASLDMIKYLVENVPHGESVLKKGDVRRDTPLHLACRGGSSAHVIEYLVKKGITAVNKTNYSLEYPLHVACGGFARFGVIKCLVENGNKQILKSHEKNGCTPTTLAALNGGYLSNLIVKYLHNAWFILEIKEGDVVAEVIAEQELSKKELLEPINKRGKEHERTTRPLENWQKEDIAMQDEKGGNHNAGQSPEELATGKQENKSKHIASLQSTAIVYRVPPGKRCLELSHYPPSLPFRNPPRFRNWQGHWARNNAIVAKSLSPEPAPKRKRETKKEYLSDILFDLWNDGLMAGKTSLAEIPFPERFKKKNQKKAYFKSLMELCDRVLLEDDKVFLFSRDITFAHPNVKEKTDKIQARAFEMMKQLDNQTAEQLQPTYALGKRYYEWSETMTIVNAKSGAPGSSQGLALSVCAENSEQKTGATGSHSIVKPGVAAADGAACIGPVVVRPVAKSEAPGNSIVDSQLQLPQIDEKDLTNPPGGLGKFLEDNLFLEDNSVSWMSKGSGSIISLRHCTIASLVSLH